MNVSSSCIQQQAKIFVGSKQTHCGHHDRRHILTSLATPEQCVSEKSEVGCDLMRKRRQSSEVKSRPRPRASRERNPRLGQLCGCRAKNMALGKKGAVLSSVAQQTRRNTTRETRPSTKEPEGDHNAGQSAKWRDRRWRHA